MYHSLRPKNGGGGGCLIFQKHCSLVPEILLLCMRGKAIYLMKQKKIM